MREQFRVQYTHEKVRKKCEMFLAKLRSSRRSGVFADVETLVVSTAEYFSALFNEEVAS